jgi:hypothetical protein
MGHRAEQPTLRRPAAQNAIVLEGAICLRSQAHTGDLKNGFMVYALRLFVKTTMTLSKAEQVARLVRKAGVFRPRELAESAFRDNTFARRKTTASCGKWEEDFTSDRGQLEDIS